MYNEIMLLYVDIKFFLKEKLTEIRRKFVDALERKLLPEVALKRKRLAKQKQVNTEFHFSSETHKLSQHMHNEICDKPFVEDIIEVC